MIQKISQNKKNKILICIHDILDSCQSNSAREVAINLSDYMISKFIKKDFDVFVGNDEDELLNNAANELFYSHAVMIASGTSMKLSDRLISEIVNKCQEEFFISGHILDRDESYFELHHQFYIIDLNEYTNINRPFIGEPEDIVHFQIEPIKSIEIIDTYIPKFIQQGNTEKQYFKKMHGWNIIRQGLIFNKKIIDLDYGIRDNKKYFYYEYDHVFIRESADLFYNQFFFNNFVVPFNSDSMSTEIEFNGPVDQYITVGTGLHWVKNLELIGFHDNTTVTFTDINPLVIIFMKKLVSTWDGKDYIDFYLKNQENELPNNVPYDYTSYIEYNRTIWNNFTQQFDNWEDTWNKVKNINFKFISIDYMSNYNLDWIEKDQRTFFNVSDVFDHVPTVFLASIKYRISCENRLIQKLKDIDEDITLKFSARAADAFLRNEHINKVKNLTLTDINEISIKPYWHDYDWKSLRILM